MKSQTFFFEHYQSFFTNGVKYKLKELLEERDKALDEYDKFFAEIEKAETQITKLQEERTSLIEGGDLKSAKKISQIDSEIEVLQELKKRIEKTQAVWQPKYSETQEAVEVAGAKALEEMGQREQLRVNELCDEVLNRINGYRDGLSAFINDDELGLNPESKLIQKDWAWLRFKGLDKHT